MRKLLSALAFGGAAAFALISPPAHATLHGWCGGGTTSLCIDNSTNSPFNLNPPNPFSFTSSPPGETGTLFLKVLVPDNESVAGPFAISGAATRSRRWSQAPRPDHGPRGPCKPIWGRHSQGKRRTTRSEHICQAPKRLIPARPDLTCTRLILAPRPLPDPVDRQTSCSTSLGRRWHPIWWVLSSSRPAAAKRPPIAGQSLLPPPAPPALQAATRDRRSFPNRALSHLSAARW
jgi:hypothetical protein